MPQNLLARRSVYQYLSSRSPSPSPAAACSGLTSIPANAKNGWFDLADRPWPWLHFPRATPVREIAISPSLGGNASQRPWPCPNKTQPWRVADRCAPPPPPPPEPVQLQPGGELDPDWFSRVPGLDASRAFVVYATIRPAGHISSKSPYLTSTCPTRGGETVVSVFLSPPPPPFAVLRLVLQFFL